MPHDEPLIEEIVGRVMEQLRASAVRQDEPAQTLPADQANQPAVVGNKVVTAELLEEVLDGGRNVVFAEESLLTPSARDYLKSHGVRWCRRRQAPGEVTPSQVWMAFVVRSTSTVDAVLDDAARNAGIRWERELLGATEEAVLQAVGALCRSSAAGAVVFAGEPEAAACRANRNSRIRAAAASDAAQTRRAREQMGANLYCIDPQGLTYAELRSLLREIVAGGTPRAPDGWSN